MAYDANGYKEDAVPPSSNKAKERERSGPSSPANTDPGQTGETPHQESRWEGPTMDPNMFYQCLVAMNKVHSGITQIGARMNKMEAEQAKVASKIEAYMGPGSSRGRPGKHHKRTSHNRKQDDTDADVEMDSDSEDEDEAEAEEAATKARRQGPPWSHLQVKDLKVLSNPRLTLA